VSKISRRDLLKLSGAAVVAATIPSFGGVATGKSPTIWAEALPGGTLDPNIIPKFQMPLIVPPAMTPNSTSGGVDYYEIAVRQFKQRILPPGLPTTTVWGYGSAANATSFSYPGYTIEAAYNRPTRVKWINDLKNPTTGAYLPHILPVDQTLHWANPPGGPAMRDMAPTFTTTPGPYTGPVPSVVHLHGSHANQESDGYSDAWYLPAASNIPAGYATVGTLYDHFKGISLNGAAWGPGNAVFEYNNVQRATALWAHDHALGMTRVNVYAGPALFYLLRGGPDDLASGLPGPAPKVGDPDRTPYYEIPLIIQDRAFNADGSLFYPDSRTFFDGFGGPYIPQSDMPPIWNPEFFGNVMVVNGRAWPYLKVEQRRYRFRVLNGCDSRFLLLKMDNGMPFHMIGSDGGFLPAPVEIGTATAPYLLLGLAERADIIVDFTNVPVGTTVTLVNVGPDEPFGGGVPGVDFPVSDPATTGQVMQFRVVPRVGADNSTPAANLQLPNITPIATNSSTFRRKVSLNELMSMVVKKAGPAAAMLGTLNTKNGKGVPLHWSDPITENPPV
jgi:bilirubin oxidase